MGCCHPVRAFRTGYKTETGADDLIRCPGSTSDLLSLQIAMKSKRVNFAIAPMATINGRRFLTSPVMQPCGKCVGCRMADAREWKIRNCLEMTYEKKCFFVTLTFDDDHILPLVKDNYVDAIQKFFKRWRYEFGKCRYYGCFEFGENTKRPHFHVLFYADIPDLRPIGPNMFASDALVRIWSQGFVFVEMVTPGNISYVCGYVEKKQKDPHWNDYAFKPFRFMSKRPSIGFRYLEDHRALFGKDPHVYGPFSESPGFNKAPLPASFKRKVKEEEYYQRLHDAAVLAGENAQEVSKLVYKLDDLSRLGFAQETALYNRLENTRKEKI